MAVHVTDLRTLEINNKDIHEEFLKGNFVTQKTKRMFSAMAHDQVHEQLNAMVKGDGGMIDITENEEALRRWTVSGPDVARLLLEYSDNLSDENQFEEEHHEQTPSVQNNFANDVKNVCQQFVEVGLGNPFSDKSKYLYHTLDTKHIMPDSVKKSIESAEDIGKSQFKTFVSERLCGNSTSFFNSIPKQNKLPMFSSILEKNNSKRSTKLSDLNSDVILFSRLYIASKD